MTNDEIKFIHDHCIHDIDQMGMEIQMLFLEYHRKCEKLGHGPEAARRAFMASMREQSDEDQLHLRIIGKLAEYGLSHLARECAQFDLEEE